MKLSENRLIEIPNVVEGEVLSQTHGNENLLPKLLMQDTPGATSKL